VNWIDKVIYAAFAVCVIASGCYYYWLVNKNLKLYEENARLETRLRDCEAAERGAAAALARQNAAVEAIRVDTVEVIKELRAITQAYGETRVAVEQSIERDTSCENRLDNIDYVMRRFHGVAELRPKNRNAD